MKLPPPTMVPSPPIPTPEKTSVSVVMSFLDWSEIWECTPLALHPMNSLPFLLL